MTPELFDRVQTVLEARRTSGERQRVHHHYLKGTIFCGLCDEKGRDGRLIFQESKGRGGVYPYFFCRQRQEGRCESRYSDIELVEEAVLRHYATLRFTADFKERVRSKVRETVDDEQRTARLRHEQLTAQLAKLDVQEENLLDLAADAALPQVKLRERLRRLQREREAIKTSLGEVNGQLAVGAALLEAALDLLADPQELYRRAGPQQRRLLNQAFFEKLLVCEEEVTGEVLTKPFAGIVEAGRRLTGTANSADRVKKELNVGTEADLLVASLCAEGSSKTAMVELRGFEPLTS